MADITSADLRKSLVQCETAAEIVSNKGVQRLLRSVAYRLGNAAFQLDLSTRDGAKNKDEVSALKGRIIELESCNKCLKADLEEAQKELGTLKVRAALRSVS